MRNRKSMRGPTIGALEGTSMSAWSLTGSVFLTMKTQDEQGIPADNVVFEMTLPEAAVALKQFHEAIMYSIEMSELHPEDIKRRQPPAIEFQ